MKVSMTISRYMAGSYLINTLLFLGALLFLIYMFDMLELIRRASKSGDVPFALLFQMGLLKLPEVGQLLFPFAVLFAAMFTFWQMNRRSELIVLRSSGFSVWQFIAPFILVSVLLGCVQIGAINPLGAILITKYEQLEGRYLERQKNQIAIFRDGLWLRQNMEEKFISNRPKTSPIAENDYIIIHARSVKQPEWILQDLSVFYFNAQDQFLKRLDALQARIEPGRWVFEEAILHEKSGYATFHETTTLSTHLSIQDIEESFSSAQSLSFWQLPQHIHTLQETGFNTARLHVYYQRLLAQPLFLATMILLAASVSIRPPRYGGTLGLFTLGIFIGFLVFFLSSYLQALGTSQQIPIFLAGWSPTFICLLLGLTAIITLEDG